MMLNTVVKAMRHIAVKLFILKHAKENPRNTQREFTILIGLTFVWALSIWTNNHQEFSSAASRWYALHCFVILYIQCFIYAVFSSYARKKKIHQIIPLLVVTLFCVTNFYLLIPIHDERIAGLHLVSTLILLTALFAIFFIALKILRDTDKSPVLMGALILVFLLHTSGTFYWNQHKTHERLAEITKIPDHFTFPEFKQRPNVYIIFFDALIPDAIARKFMGIEKLQYNSTMRDEGLHILRNVFADRILTKESINSFIAMDLSYFDTIPLNARHLFDTGEVVGPLYESFRRNNYKIQFIYASSYFGRKEKSNLDFYAIAREYDLCAHIDNDYAFMGYCMSLSSMFRKDLRKRFFTVKQDHEWPSYMYARIKEMSKSPDRWLTLSYIRHPLHNSPQFGGFSGYVESFKKKGDPSATRDIVKLIQLIRENDRDSVLVILGDHGAFFKSKMTDVTPGKLPITHFLDRHAIAAAVYPKDFCADEFKQLSSAARIGRTIIKCLSGGEDPLPAEYQANDDYLRDYFYE